MNQKAKRVLKKVSFTLNGEIVSIECDETISILEALREHLDVISPKDGCSPQGQCGCCTILLNEKPLMSCTQNVMKLEGSKVVTLEGMAARKREVLAASFVKTGGLQCGFCIPGIAVRVAGLLDKNPEPTDRQIRNALQPHLCRCTGYVKIFDAVKEAATHWQTDTLSDLADEGSVGASTPRYLGSECVLGEKPYIDDMRVPGMLHGAVLLSEHPRARVISIDTSEAEALEGVEKICTAKDLVADKKVGLIEKDWPVFVGEGEMTHCVGSVIAAVAASERSIARAATALIKVEYEVLPPVTTPEEAILEGASEVHEGRGNLLRTCLVKRGDDIESALAASAHVLTETFHTQRIEHAFLEPESALVIPSEQDGEGIHLYTQGQGVHEDQRQIAAVLGLPIEKVRVTLISNGGAFGGKEDLSIQAHTAVLATQSKQPVKLTLSREQSMLMHPKRHPIKMTYTIGCDEKGHLTAVKARIIGDTGAYASVGDKVMERAAGHSCGPYRTPAVDVEALTVYTNNVPCGAFRGFGVNQTAFGIEGMLDRMAEVVGINRYDIRDRNILEVGDRFGPGQKMNESLGIRACLEAIKPYFESEKFVGLACGIKNTGIGNGMPDIGRALIRVDGPNAVTLFTGFTEMGQGLFTVLQQVLGEEAGLRPSQISVTVNTDYSVECGMTTASRATVLAGEATKRAALKLKAAFDDGKSLSDLVGEQFHGEFICTFTSKPGQGGEDEITHLTFGYAVQLVILNDDGTLKEVIAAHDVGRVMNRIQCEGQIEGAIHMGLGYALTEDMPCIDGRPASTDLNDMRIIRAKHVPDIKVLLLEVPDTIGPYGAKGVGEIGLVPTAAAVASALHSFDGIRRIRLPMRGSAAARAILPRKLREEDHS